ncbi:DUF3786 domain-containing protein [Chloroflexota bacterium]
MSKASDQTLLEKVNWLREQIRLHNSPDEFSSKTGMTHSLEEDNQFFGFQYFNSNVKLSYPELIAVGQETGIPLDVGSQAVISYYGYMCLQSEIDSVNNDWVSFSKLTDGMFYNQAFQGYTGDVLSKHANWIFENRNSIISAYDAKTIEVGDISFHIKVLPKVSLALVIWLGDEDFPASCKILFEKTVNLFLPTDACAILGSMFTQRILKMINR